MSVPDITSDDVRPPISMGAFKSITNDHRLNPQRHNPTLRLLFKPSKPCTSPSPALIIVHPAGGVKEQTASTYASSSGGEPRFLEDPNARVSDIWSVVDYLERLDSVDPEKIGIVGICAGGGYATAAAKADQRIKCVATVSLVNIGDSARYGWLGQEAAAKQRNILVRAARQISAEGKGAEYATVPYVPPKLEDGDGTPVDLREAHECYLTSRGQLPSAQNKMLLRSVLRTMTFDAFHLADLFLKQPVLLIAGEKAESRWHTEKLDEMIAYVTEKVIVPKARHVDFYDRDEFVDPAVLKIAQFMKARLV